MRHLPLVLFLLVAGSVLAPVSRAGEEPLAGPLVLAGETNWNGEVAVTRDLLVPAGASLVVHEGTQVTFPAGAGLTVEGTLVVRGGPGKETVRFASSGESKWKGIVLREGTARISGLHLSGATVGLAGAGGSLTLDRSTLEGNGKGASLGNGGEFSLDRVSFVGGEVGLEAQFRARGRVTNCAFIRNQRGIGMGGGALLRVEGCRFQEDQIGVVATQESGSSFDRNLFDRCGIGIRFYQAGSGAQASRNLFRRSGEAAVQVLAFSRPILYDNSVEGGKNGFYAFQFSAPVIRRNQVSGCGKGIYLDHRCDALVTENLIADNQVGIMLDFSSYPVLRQNHLSGNDLHLSVGRFQSRDWEIREGSVGIMRRTASQGNSGNQALASARTTFPPEVDASGNWWDEATLKEMREKGEGGDISTLFDLRDLPAVTYEGYEGKAYSIDRVAFVPWLEGTPRAGLSGWRGSEEELASDRPGGVEGRLIGEDGVPLAGVRVSAWPRGGLLGEPTAISAPSGADGLYSLRLAPGRYALAAAGGGLFSLSGQSPVTVLAGEKTRLGFVLLPWTPPDRQGGMAAEDGGAVRGRVTLRGKGVEGVVVSLYREDDDFFRGPAFLSAPTGEDGSFSLEMVPPSAYFLVGRKRRSGQPVGPMLKGDLFGYLKGNPLEVRAGEAVTVLLPLLEKKLERDPDEKGERADPPGLSGIVRDPLGKPVAGVHVFASLEPEMGRHKPAALSTPTDLSGRFTLLLPGPGRYYLGARQGFGGSLAPGEWFGFLAGKTAGGFIEFGEGEFRPGMDITVERTAP